jgi:hypothetical protein
VPDCVRFRTPIVDVAAVHVEIVVEIVGSGARRSVEPVIAGFEVRGECERLNVAARGRVMMGTEEKSLAQGRIGG